MFQAEMIYRSYWFKDVFLFKLIWTKLNFKFGTEMFPVWEFVSLYNTFVIVWLNWTCVVHGSCFANISIIFLHSSFVNHFFSKGIQNLKYITSFHRLSCNISQLRIAFAFLFHYLRRELVSFCSFSFILLYWLIFPGVSTIHS